MNKSQESGEKLGGGTECKQEDDEFVFWHSCVFISYAHANETPTRQAVRYLELNVELRWHDQEMGIDDYPPKTWLL